MKMVEDLDFHGIIRGVATGKRSADPEAVVGAGREFEFEMEDEIVELIDGVEVAAGFADDVAVLDDVAFGVTLPAGKIAAVE